MTRQRLWQLRKKAMGQCVRCGRRREGHAQHCEPCAQREALLKREWWRRRHPGCVPRYDGPPRSTTRRSTSQQQEGER